jgi:hypothetical protein
MTCFLAFLVMVVVGKIRASGLCALCWTTVETEIKKMIDVN